MDIKKIGVIKLCESSEATKWERYAIDYILSDNGRVRRGEGEAIRD